MTERRTLLSKNATDIVVAVVAVIIAGALHEGAMQIHPTGWIVGPVVHAFAVKGLFNFVCQTLVVMFLMGASMKLVRIIVPDDARGIICGKVRLTLQRARRLF